MKKIKVYILTYKRNDVLNELLINLFEKSDFKDIPNTQVNILNNHTGIKIEDKIVGLFWVDNFEYGEKIIISNNHVMGDLRNHKKQMLLKYGK